MAERDDRADGEPPATGEVLRALLHSGLLPRAAFAVGMRELGYRPDWRRWSRLLLLLFGGGLILCGIVFFVAFHWMGLHRAVKLAGLQVLLLGCAIGAWRVGLDRLVGRALLFAACVLVGAFLAAFGQTYQTGADVWELFRGWGALIVLWVIAARSMVHWLLLLAITNAAINLHLQHVRFYHWGDEPWAWLLMAAPPALWLLGFELVRYRGYLVARQVWARWVLVPAVLFCLTMPVTVVIFGDRYQQLPAWVAIAALAASIGGGYRYYRRVGRRGGHDLFALTCIGFTAAWIVTMVAIRIVVDGRDGGCGSLVFVGLLVIGELTFLSKRVQQLNIEMRQEAQRDR